MIEVTPKDGSDASFEKAMMIFKKLVSKDGRLQEIKERRYFRKPSEVAREKRRRQKSNKRGENNV